LYFRLLAYDINVACSASLEITRTLRSFVLLSLVSLKKI
jgi:hypothetical protein